VTETTAVSCSFLRTKPLNYSIHAAKQISIVSQQSEQRIRQPEQKKDRTLKSWHLLPLTQNREEPKKDSEIGIEPETSFEKHDVASRWITPPQNMP